MTDDVPSFGLQYMYGSVKGPEAPAFCPEDGYPMRVSERRTGFDPATGLPIMERRADCTSPRWMRLFGHWFFVQDSYGDWPRTMI